LLLIFRPGEFGNKTKLSEGFYNHELVAGNRIYALAKGNEIQC
jgi:hypothetical protein